MSDNIASNSVDLSLPLLSLQLTSTENIDPNTAVNNNINHTSNGNTSANSSVKSTPINSKRFIPTKRETLQSASQSTTTDTTSHTPTHSTHNINSARRSSKNSTVLHPTPNKQSNTSRRTTLQSNTTDASSMASTQPSARELTPIDNVQSSIISDLSLLPELHRICASNNYLQAQQLITLQPVELRIEYVNQLDSMGNTPLFYTLTNEHIQSGVTALLLDYGCNVNAQNNKKNTALHVAFFSNYKRFVRMLIGEFNASVTIMNCGEQLCYQTAPQPKGYNNDSVTAQFQHNGAMLHFITQCTDTYTDNINKKLILPHTNVQRAYYRSLYDLADIHKYGYITLQNTIQLLNQQINHAQSKEDKIIDTQLLSDWYRQLDRDKNGLVYFNEFLYAVLAQLNEQEKLRRKTRRKAQVKAAKLAKKAEDAARFAKYKS